MTWQEVDRMSLKKEFLQLAQNENTNFSELCRRFGISRKTGYKWLNRFRAGGVENLSEQSRKPNHCPHQTVAEMERQVCVLRKDHSAWGGRKIRRTLLNQGHSEVPAASTITDILRRHQLLDEAECLKHKPIQRFEKESPNELWQMDFKGQFSTLRGDCFPLSIEDDHSRFVVGLISCANQQRDTTQRAIQQVFEVYGLPASFLMDNGPPWGGSENCEYTQLWVWFIRLGVRVFHGRPYHPQTQGKVERFHRTLKAELIQGTTFIDLDDCQRRFDAWRMLYNFERPHEALELEVPASRYVISPRPFPPVLPPIEYGAGVDVRKVQMGGRIDYHGHRYSIGHGFVGLPVAIKPSQHDGISHVYFCQQKIKILNLHSGTIQDTDGLEGEEKEGIIGADR